MARRRVRRSGSGVKTISMRIEGGEELVEALRQLEVDVVNVRDEAVQEGGEIIRAEAESRAPGEIFMNLVTDAVKLITSVVMSVAGNQSTVEIGPDREHWYFMYFETGAQPHEVEPRNDTILWFGGREGSQFAPKVDHPGIPADPFLRPAVDSHGKQAIEKIGEVFKKALEAKAKPG